MKPCTLMMPDKLADYFERHTVENGTTMLSCALMLVPLLFQGKLTHAQIAKLMNLDEDAVNAIYDCYQLPHRNGHIDDWGLEVPDRGSAKNESYSFDNIVSVLTIEQIKEKIAPVCKEYGIQAAYLSGSYARGDARADSNVNIRVECGKHSEVHGWAVGGFYRDLMTALGKPVELLTCIPVTIGEDFVKTLKQEETLIYPLKKER